MRTDSMAKLEACAQVRDVSVSGSAHWPVLARYRRDAPIRVVMGSPESPLSGGRAPRKARVRAGQAEWVAQQIGTFGDIAGSGLGATVTAY